jgi:hypothetical protein
MEWLEIADINTLRIIRVDIARVDASNTIRIHAFTTVWVIRVDFTRVHMAVRVIQINFARLQFFATIAMRTVATDVTVCWDRIHVDAEWAVVSIRILIAGSWAAILHRVEFARIK